MSISPFSTALIFEGKFPKTTYSNNLSSKRGYLTFLKPEQSSVILRKFGWKLSSLVYILVGFFSFSFLLVGQLESCMGEEVQEDKELSRSSSIILAILSKSSRTFFTGFLLYDKTWVFGISQEIIFLPLKNVLLNFYGDLAAEVFYHQL